MVTWEPRHVSAWSANSLIVVGGPAECLKTRVVIWIEEEEIHYMVGSELKEAEMFKTCLRKARDIR